MATESDFQQILQQIGGKSNVHLISAGSGPDGHGGVLKDFIADIFHDEDTTECDGLSNGEVKVQTREKTAQSESDRSEQSSSTPAPICTKPSKTVTSSKNVSGKQRSIKCSLIIFIFKSDYVCSKENKGCLREIMKDVRARVKRNELRPALIGLIHTDSNESHIRESVDFIDRSIRSVFPDHPHQTIWTGRYVTKDQAVLRDIKINACKAVKFSLCADSSFDGNPSSTWPLMCLPGIFRKSKRGEADLTSIKWQQDKTQTMEEGIPLQMRATTQ